MGGKVGFPIQKLRLEGYKEDFYWQGKMALRHYRMLGLRERVIAQSTKPSAALE